MRTVRCRYRAAKAPPPGAPVVAVLLYRKHVITRQPYLNQLARTQARRATRHSHLHFPTTPPPSLPLCLPGLAAPSAAPSRLAPSDTAARPPVPPQVYGLEEQGLIPVPIFINGIEAHTVVRDVLTSAHEQQERANGNVVISSLKPNAIVVDAVVSTIGFPLVGASSVS